MSVSFFNSKTTSTLTINGHKVDMTVVQDDDNFSNNIREFVRAAYNYSRTDLAFFRTDMERVASILINQGVELSDLDTMLHHYSL